jgi:hypothetical protein
LIYPDKKLIQSLVAFFFLICITSIFKHFKRSFLLRNINCIDMRRLMIILTGSLLLILSGCQGYIIPAPECPDNLPTNVSFASDVQPIFDQNCVACHGGGQVPTLISGWSHDELVDGGYVDTDFPCSSIIYEKLTGNHSGRASDEEILTILGWIAEGAQDN